MTDRKTLLIAAIFIVVMLAAAIARIALPSGWTPASVSAHSHDAYALFHAPAVLVVLTVLLLARNWISRNPADEQRPWQSQGRLVLIVCGALITGSQLFMIAQSLGVTVLAPIVVARASLALTGVLMMVTGNQLPKLPWLQHRAKMLALEPVQSAKMLRFSGWMTVGFGAGLIVCASVVPAERMLSVVWILYFSLMSLYILRMIQLKREQRR